MILIELDNEGPKLNEPAPCMVMTMRQGKQNQHGKVEYMGCMRNADPILCSLSALAFYFFNRWGKQGAQEFPSFRQPEDYYNQYVFPGDVRMSERPLSYATQREWNKKMFDGVGIHSKEITHCPRKEAARHAELGGVKETQIRRAGRWNADALTGAYLSYLPREYMRAIAGWPKEGKGYFLPRAQEIPDETLCSKIWPEADVWLDHMESYHPSKEDNKVVRLDLAGSGFLRLLRVLRIVLLQDSVLLRKLFPQHPLWKDSLFSCEEYQQFAARVERSLANVIMPDELIMQKYWPAHEAVAKLRHEATISEINSAQQDIRQVSERLNQIERSSASFASPAPIWIQQGSTGVWIGSKGSGSIQQQLLPPLPPPPLPPSQESLASSSLIEQPPPPPSPFILDPEAPPKEYEMLRGSNSILQLWNEWTLGLAGGPSVEALDRCWGTGWRNTPKDAVFYGRRKKVIKEIQRRVRDGIARDIRQAIDQVEQLRGTRSLDWLCRYGL